MLMSKKLKPGLKEGALQRRLKTAWRKQ